MRPAAFSSLLLISACAALPPGSFQDRALPRSVRVDRIVVYKAAGRLEAWAGSRLVKSYRAAVGSAGAGDKQYEGDRTTPEGQYRISGRHHSSRFHRFLAVSYPNRADRRRFRAAGDRPDGARIGGAIGIHGEHPSPFVPATSIDWTAGCIAVTDEAVEELYRVVRPRAEVVIKP